ncbi:MAG: hypothetical protein ABI310_06875 [Microbacteriaceae bacterium]
MTLPKRFRIHNRMTPGMSVMVLSLPVNNLVEPDKIWSLKSGAYSIGECEQVSQAPNASKN